MTQIEVMFFGTFRDACGCFKRQFTLDGEARLSHLIAALAKEHKSPFRKAMVNNGRILINGREHGLLGGEEAPLREGDTVVFLSPIFGGGATQTSARVSGRGQAPSRSVNP